MLAVVQRQPRAASPGEDHSGRRPEALTITPVDCSCEESREGFLLETGVTEDQSNELPSRAKYETKHVGELSDERTWGCKSPGRRCAAGAELSARPASNRMTHVEGV